MVGSLRSQTTLRAVVMGRLHGSMQMETWSVWRSSGMISCMATITSFGQMENVQSGHNMYMALKRS